MVLFPPVSQDRVGYRTYILSYIKLQKIRYATFRYIIKELRRCMPEAECIVIPESSHMMQAANPGAYNAQVLSFLSRH